MNNSIVLEFDDRLAEVYYEFNKAERMTWDSPGCSAYYYIGAMVWTDTGEEMTKEEFAQYEDEAIEALWERRNERYEY